MKLLFTLFLIAVALLLAPLSARAISPAMPDLVIVKTTQTSSTFWMVKVKNVGQMDSAPTTLKMVARPGGSYSCPVPAIKAGGTADVPCRMPFKSRPGMQAEFILNPDKSLAENNYGNNRTTSSTNPKFN